MEIRGPGITVLQLAFYVTSMGNTIRGLVIDDMNRAILLDKTDAHDNRIVGNWIGFHADGTLAGKSMYGILINNGASNNLIGTSNLADRNVIGNVTKGVDSFGAGEVPRPADFQFANG